jgi:Zn-dependent alcohol dehydrogenase
MQVTLTIAGGQSDGRRATATLADTPTARAFASQLPLTLDMHDLLGREKPGTLPRPLHPTGEGKAIYEAGDLGYWSPNHDLAIFYLAAQQLGADRIIAMSRHEPRQNLAREFGATDIVTDRGDDGVAAVKDLTDGLGAHSVIEAVGTQESMMQAIRSTRPGGHVGYVGVAHNVTLPGEELFYSHVHLHGGPAPVRRFLPDLIDRIWKREIDPGQVFDLTLPLDQVAEGYKAMDERRAIKTLLQP